MAGAAVTPAEVAAERGAHPAGSVAARPTRVRHAVLGLTVLAYLITYMDRVVISTAAAWRPISSAISARDRSARPGWPK